MTILENLREKYQEIDKDDKHDIDDYTELIDSLFLHLENALLKLKNRGVQIKDLTHRNNAYQESIELIYDIINDEKIDADETIASISKIVKDN